METPPQLLAGPNLVHGAPPHPHRPIPPICVSGTQLLDVKAICTVYP